jgi:hypothetical protein
MNTFEREGANTRPVISRMDLRSSCSPMMARTTAFSSKMENEMTPFMDSL